MSVCSVLSFQPKSQGRSWTKAQSILLWSEAYETPSNALAERADPDQAADHGLLCLLMEISLDMTIH